mgnify:CR=1 FL=1
MPNGLKMTGAKHSNNDMIIYDTPQESRTNTAMRLETTSNVTTVSTSYLLSEPSASTSSPSSPQMQPSSPPSSPPASPPASPPSSPPASPPASPPSSPPASPPSSPPASPPSPGGYGGY